MQYIKRIPRHVAAAAAVEVAADAAAVAVNLLAEMKQFLFVVCVVLASGFEINA